MPLLASMFLLQLSLLTLDAHLFCKFLLLSPAFVVLLLLSLLLHLFGQHLRLQAPPLSFAIGMVGIVAKEVAAAEAVWRFMWRQVR